MNLILNSNDFLFLMEQKINNLNLKLKAFQHRRVGFILVEIEIETVLDESMYAYALGDISEGEIGLFANIGNSMSGGLSKKDNLIEIAIEKQKFLDILYLFFKKIEKSKDKNSLWYFFIESHPNFSFENL